MCKTMDIWTSPRTITVGWLICTKSFEYRNASNESFSHRVSIDKTRRVPSQWLYSNVAYRFNMS